jgi:drug/metabolite transporter (DMT)-like permease
VFVMLLMRGGVLILAPVVDALTGRRARWFSWVGLGLSMAALVVAFVEQGGYAITLACAVDVTAYLGAYFVRLRVMSKLAKSHDREVTLRYFVEEQLVSVPAALGMLVLVALWGQGTFMQQVRAGFCEVPFGELLWPTLLVGVLSQGTGIFGTLVFLDPSENTFSVPVNRCSSILAGVVASVGLAVGLGGRWPSAHQLGGAGLVVLAIVVLTLGPRWMRSRARP